MSIPRLLRAANYWIRERPSSSPAAPQSHRSPRIRRGPQKDGEEETRRKTPQFGLGERVANRSTVKPLSARLRLVRRADLSHLRDFSAAEDRKRNNRMQRLFKQRRGKKQGNQENRGSLASRRLPNQEELLPDYSTLFLLRRVCVCVFGGLTHIHISLPEKVLV